jgi:hypothetical protein
MLRGYEQAMILFVPHQDNSDDDFTPTRIGYYLLRVGDDGDTKEAVGIHLFRLFVSIGH